MQRFWHWIRNETTVGDPAPPRTLFIDGVIASDSWFDDDITPDIFRQELFSSTGDVEIFLNSPGGDCVAATQIYTMLLEYRGDVIIKIDGIAASAASVVAMAGTTVMMAPSALLMVHNPLTCAIGDTDEMRRAIAMLDEVKEAIITAYEIHTGLSRAKLAHLMDDETWLSANKAIELGFCDQILTDEKKKRKQCAAQIDAFGNAWNPESAVGDSYTFSRRTYIAALMNKVMPKVTRNPRMMLAKNSGQGIMQNDEQPDGKQKDEATQTEQTPNTQPANTEPITPALDLTPNPTSVPIDSFDKRLSLLSH